VHWLDLGTARLAPANADLWVIAGDGGDFMRPSKRYALSLLAATLRQHRGERFPIIGLTFANHCRDGDAANLPAPAPMGLGHQPELACEDGRAGLQLGLERMRTGVLRA